MRRYGEYLVHEGCLDLRRCRSWVDEAKKWNPPLSGDRFSQTQRKLAAFIMDKWEEAHIIGVPSFPLTVTT